MQVVRFIHVFRALLSTVPYHFILGKYTSWNLRAPLLRFLYRSKNTFMERNHQKLLFLPVLHCARYSKMASYWRCVTLRHKSNYQSDQKYRNKILSACMSKDQV